MTRMYKSWLCIIKWKNERNLMKMKWLSICRFWYAISIYILDWISHYDWIQFSPLFWLFYFTSSDNKICLQHLWYIWSQLPKHELSGLPNYNVTERYMFMFTLMYDVLFLLLLLLFYFTDIGSKGTLYSQYYCQHWP
jgi:hypothetical protein